MRPRTIFLRWTGEVFIPNASFQVHCEREFEMGEVYPMQIVEERSQASHNHYFAALQEGWRNLSEENAKHFPTPEHLRHWALVQTGYFHEAFYEMATNFEARKLALDLRRRDPYAVIVVRGSVVRVYSAESQSSASMKKERFQQSKNDVLDLVASMARTSRVQLLKHAGRTG